MTTRLSPGSPKLTIDGKVPEGNSEVIADSEWEGLDNTEDPEAKTQENLVKIARGRKQGGRPRRAKG